MYGKSTSPKTSLRPRARPKSLLDPGSVVRESEASSGRGPKVGEGSTRHPTGKNINKQPTIVFTRAKPKNSGPKVGEKGLKSLTGSTPGAGKNFYTDMLRIDVTKGVKKGGKKGGKKK